MSRTIYLELVLGSRMASDLAVGGLFVMDKTLAMQDQCEIIVFNDGGQLELPARAVYLDGKGGVGLEVIGFCEAIKVQLADLIEAGVIAAATMPATEEQPALRDEDGTEELPLLTVEQLALDIEDQPALARGSDLELAPDELAAAALELAPDDAPVRDTIELVPDDAPGRDTIELAPDDVPVRDTIELAVPTGGILPIAEQAGDQEEQEHKSLHEKLRGLPLAQQVKRAKVGGVTERTLLERLYGKNVWESLLRNPALTAPEVARIARMGGLPRPLLEIIVGNGGWLQVPEVRRALLSNPRLGNDHIIKLLRMMSKPELKLATAQTAYSMGVRSQAKAMLKAEGG